MYRYFALVWNSNDASATSVARDLARELDRSLWEKVLDADGLIAFHAGIHRTSCETRTLAGQQGAVFGRLFQTGNELSPAPKGRHRDASESEQISRTTGTHLIDHYWGRYVAVVRDEASGAVWVLRDPTGGLPCFVTHYQSVSIVFSDMESCLDLRRLTFSINWRYVAAFVPYAALQIRDTGLNEVTEVQAGERLTFSEKGIERRTLWNPVEVARRSPIEDFDEAVAAVRRTVEMCVHAWASLHRKVIHNLSGGLDSSIVLSCLRSAPTQPEITCLHYFSPSSNEDERKYARLAATHLGAPLIEQALDASTIRLERLLQIRHAPKPWFYVYDLVHSPIEVGVAAEYGATGVFSGSGGDGLFLQARADLAVADYLHRHGFRPGAVRVALNAARITRTSLWPILRQGVMRHLRRPAGGVMSQPGDARALIPAAVLAAARSDDKLIHPWIREAGRIPPGLLWHVLCLSVPPMFYESFGGATDLERTPVLMSQPLMELCLRIPSYVWITGGRDRAIARRAFADELPATIVRRQQKGGIDRHNRMMLDANRAFIREMLVDGLLVQHGLLDGAKLDACLSRGGPNIGLEYNEVLRQHLCTEVWLRRWSDIERRAAAGSCLTSSAAV